MGILVAGSGLPGRKKSWSNTVHSEFMVVLILLKNSVMIGLNIALIASASHGLLLSAIAYHRRLPELPRSWSAT
jgi:hypothetical protein